ncbi:hypothetical protein RND71_003184 [Anisodus tanguticus]|uniref:Uncharacterized protein n=1 Tax=Anisodus tanguticus TaxID=243964 RepID=A0AAE1SSU7_9SOLA|nr:hypothetical protein RND71_003184 [Anisodus tanguticus]
MRGPVLVQRKIANSQKTISLRNLLELPFYLRNNLLIRTKGQIAMPSPQQVPLEMWLCYLLVVVLTFPFLCITER